MANRPLSGSHSKLVSSRHGKTGHVMVRVDVEPRLKDELIALAERDRTSVSWQIRMALEDWVAGGEWREVAA